MSYIMADSRIILRIDTSRRKKVREAARSRGVTESELVREAIDRHLRDLTIVSAYDRLKRSKAIGVARRTPTDLSTNKAHFQGFGE